VLGFHDTLAVCPVAPVPDRTIVTVGLLALSVTVILPLAGPSADGVKETFIATEVPGERVTPLDMPIAEKPAPPIVTFETITFELLVFVKVTTRVLAPPTLTFPKFRALVLGFRPEMTFCDRATFCDVEGEAPTVPLHPDWLMMANKTAAHIRYATLLVVTSRVFLWRHTSPWTWAIIEPKILAQPPDCYCP
jgi:hypothetical protein